MVCWVLVSTLNSFSLRISPQGNYKLKTLDPAHFSPWHLTSATVSILYFFLHSSFCLIHKGMWGRSHDFNETEDKTGDKRERWRDRERSHDDLMTNKIWNQINHVTEKGAETNWSKTKWKLQPSSSHLSLLNLFGGLLHFIKSPSKLQTAEWKLYFSALFTEAENRDALWEPAAEESNLVRLQTRPERVPACRLERKNGGL